MTRRLSPSFRKLPKLARSIERNHAKASARLRLAFEQLVNVTSAGPGGGSPTDDYGEQVLQEEVDAAIDTLQELLDKQQQALEDLGDDGASSDGSGHGGAGGTNKPCQGDLLLYQAALKANDTEAAQRYLAAYSQCLRVHSPGITLNKPESP